jgi:hypothetical protein
MTTREQVLDLRQRISAAVVGQPQVVDHLLIAMLANGHVLLEGEFRFLKITPHSAGPLSSIAGSLPTALVSTPSTRMEASPMALRKTPWPTLPSAS